MSILSNCINILTFFAGREPQVLCYLTSWSSKRPSAGRFMPENVDPTLCTHVIYAFATLKDHKLAEGDEKDADMYDKVVALREKNPNLKVRMYIENIIIIIMSTHINVILK